MKGLLLFLIATLLVGCFDIVEEVTYEDAIKGKYTLIANCSQSKLKLKTILKLDSFMGVNVPSESEIKTQFNKIETAIKATPGVTNVSKIADFENYIFNITFQFNNTETLNKALNNAATVSSNTNLPFWNVFNYSNNTFIRNKTPNDSIAKLAKQQSAKLNLIAGANYTSVYRFHTEVQSSSNPKATISKNKKAVMLKQSIKDIILNPQVFSNTIKL